MAIGRAAARRLPIRRAMATSESRHETAQENLEPRPP